MPQEIPTQPDQTPIPLFNPDVKDFVFEWDMSETNERYVLPAFSVETFPRFIADRLANKLADYLIGKRGVKYNYFKDKADCLNEIYMR